MGWLRRMVGRRGVTQDDTPTQPDPELQGLLDEYGLSAFDRQLALSEILGDRDWTFNQDDGVLRIGDDITLPAQILGSVSKRSRTWLWAWANESIDDALDAGSRRLARIGREHGLTILVEPQLDLARIIDGHLLALGAVGILDADAYFRGSHPGGEVFLLVTEPRVRQPAPVPAVHAVNVISAATSLPQIVTPAGIANYLRGLGLAVIAEAGEIRLGPGDAGVFRFDELGRLVEVRVTVDAAE